MADILSTAKIINMHLNYKTDAQKNADQYQARESLGKMNRKKINWISPS